MGEGDSSAKVLLIGEAPGYEEDSIGKPFVGDAGKILRMMIKRLGLKQENFFLSNIFRCRPPDNKLPSGEKILRGWINSCATFMVRDLENFFGEPISQELDVSIPRTTPSEYVGVEILRSKLLRFNKSVVLLGGTPLLAFSGRSAITKFEGRQLSSFVLSYKNEPWAKRVWVAFHPAYALPGRRPAIAVNIYRVIYKAARQCRLRPSPKTLEEMRNDVGIRSVLGARH